MSGGRPAMLSRQVYRNSAWTTHTVSIAIASFSEGPQAGCSQLQLQCTGAPELRCFMQ